MRRAIAVIAAGGLWLCPFVARAQQTTPPADTVTTPANRPRKLMSPICTARAAGLYGLGGNMLGIPVSAAGVETGVGCPRLNLGSVRLTPGLSSDFLIGHTQYGLNYWSLSAGPEIDVSASEADRLHLNVSVNAVYDRVSGIGFFGIGATARIALDLIRVESSAGCGSAQRFKPLCRSCFRGYP